MSKRIVLMSVLLTMVLSLAAMSATSVTINTYEASPFLYGGCSYVPLRSTAGFLGAPLRWNAAASQVVITYRNKDFALTLNSTKGYYGGQPVMLPYPPVVINGVTYVPLETFRKYYNVPVEWDGTRFEIRIMGPGGWGTMKASSRPPWHGGPPPWAPAWGQRGYGTPGHPSYAKPSGNGKAKAWGQHGYVAPGHPSKVRARGNGKGKSWGQRGYVAPGHSAKVKANGHGRSEGNKKGR